MVWVVGEREDLALSRRTKKPGHQRHLVYSNGAENNTVGKPGNLFDATLLDHYAAEHVATAAGTAQPIGEPAGSTCRARLQGDAHQTPQ